MQDCPNQEGVARLLPMVPPLQGPFRIDQNVRDVLDIAHFGVSAPDLEQRVVSRGFRVGRIEKEDAGEPRASSRSAASSRP